MYRPSKVVGVDLLTKVSQFKSQDNQVSHLVRLDWLQGLKLASQKKKSSVRIQYTGTTKCSQ